MFAHMNRSNCIIKSCHVSYWQSEEKIEVFAEKQGRVECGMVEKQFVWKATKATFRKARAEQKTQYSCFHLTNLSISYRAKTTEDNVMSQSLVCSSVFSSFFLIVQRRRG